MCAVSTGGNSLHVGLKIDVGVYTWRTWVLKFVNISLVPLLVKTSMVWLMRWHHPNASRRIHIYYAVIIRI